MAFFHLLRLSQPQNLDILPKGPLVRALLLPLQKKQENAPSEIHRKKTATVQAGL